MMALLLFGCVFSGIRRAFAKDQRAGNLAWFLADVGGLQRRYSRREAFARVPFTGGDFFVRLSLISCSLLGLFFFSSLNKRSLLMLWACISP